MPFEHAALFCDLTDNTPTALLVHNTCVFPRFNIDVWGSAGIGGLRCSARANTPRLTLGTSLESPSRCEKMLFVL